MKQFAIVARPDEASGAIQKLIKEKLQAVGYQENEQEPDVVFVVGGDGTFIYAVHQYLDQLARVQFYGIHTGTFGFFTDYHDANVNAFMDAYLQDKLHEVRYPLLCAHVNEKSYYAINEVRIENASRTQVMDVYLNDQLFETYRGSGMLVCTQLGSTAYNRSLGGAIIQDGLEAIEMTEIAGIHHNKYRSLGSSIVLKKDTTIQFDSENYQGALLGVDAKVYPIEKATKVIIEVARNQHVRMLKGNSISYFERLHSLF
ncbi:MAG: NAD kinase [Solobacterium sp.]|nr:NAD kinase [Solobacterium sp.]